MDWIAALLNLIGLLVLAGRPVVGMYFFVGSSLAFLVWAIDAEVWSIALLQSILLVLNIRVIMRWRKTK